MSTFFHTLCLVIFGLMSIIALLGNGFIIAVNGHSWLHRQKLIPCGLLLTCLSLSRFLMQGLLMTGQYLYHSSPRTYEFSRTDKLMNIAWNYCNMASFSCDTGLSVFYCLKVTTFAHPPFPWLKLNIDRLMPRLLAIPCIAFVFFSLPSFIAYLNQGERHIAMENLTEHRHSKSKEIIAMLAPVQFSLTALCFIVCFAASVVLLASLGRHMRNLKKNGLEVTDVSTWAHLNIMKSLLCFLFFFVLYFLVTNVAFLKDFRTGSIEHLICIVLLSSYPSAHSVILILTNFKLKETCVQILKTGKRYICVH